MQPSDDLFLLVKSLTKAEKRYFKMQASLQKGEKDYLLLFDEIEALIASQRKDNKEPVYDEAALKSRLKGKISHSQLHVMKNYLAGLILKSLRGLREKNNSQYQIVALMSEARLLEQKGLYDQCMKKLESAKALCLKFEKHAALIEILDIERTLFVRFGVNMVEEEIEKRRTAILKHSRLLENTMFYKDLHNRALALYRKENRVRKETVREKMIAILEEELLQDDQKASTFQSKLSFHHIHAVFEQMNGNFLTANQHYKNLLDIWIGYPHFKEEYPSLFIIYASNYLVSCHTIGKYEPFQSLLEELKKIPCRSFYEEAEAFQNICFLEQLYFMNKGMFEQMGANADKAKTLALEIEEGLKKHGDKIVKSRELSFLHNTAVMFFALSNYDEALRWISKIQQTNKTDQRKEVRLFARLMQLLIFTERGEHLHIDNAFKAFSYHLKTEDKLNDFEGTVTHYLKQNALRKRDTRELFEEFQQRLSDYQQQKIPFYEEISIWIESKLRNLTFYEVLKERVEKS